MSLYLHFPFCKRKCDYCDFNSYADLESLIFPYAEAIKAEIKTYLPQSNSIRSVFFGGGTPSYIPVRILADLLLFIKENFRLAPDAEITLETNPGTISGSELAYLKTAGFNRLSIGLQAAQNRLLNGIGSIHSREQFLSVYKAARDTGFSNIGIDIMFGLPGQLLQDWDETLEQVTALEPEHISAYGLQLEAGTKLAADIAGGLTQLPSEELVVEMMQRAMDHLLRKGYRHYEISNYARPGFESVHNLRYWYGGDYLGFGAGACSTVNNQRWSNIKEPWTYVRRLSEGVSVIAEREELDVQTRAIEALMLGLRLRDGVDLRQYQNEYGINLFETAGSELKSLSGQKLITVNDSRLALTDAGIILSNMVIGKLLNGI